MVTKVVVARVGGPGPTEEALAAEGVEFEARDVAHAPDAYGRMIADLWREGEGFILFEHDIVPWAGAVMQLAACPEAWCTHAYPGTQALFMSIGVTKISSGAIAAHPQLYAAWEGQFWGAVDAHMIPALHSCYALHGHWPPFRHTRFE